MQMNNTDIKDKAKLIEARKRIENVSMINNYGSLRGVEYSSPMRGIAI